MGGKSQKVPSGSKRLLKIGAETAEVMAPGVQRTGMDLNAITAEILRTGGTGALSPMIKQAREQALVAGGQGERAMQGALAASGLEGSPYAAGLLANQAQQTGMAASAAEQNQVGRFITGYLPSLAQLPGQLAGPFMGVAQAPIGAAAQYANANAAAQSGAYGAIGTGAGIIGGVAMDAARSYWGGGAGSAGSAAPVNAPNYVETNPAGGSMYYSPPNYGGT